MEAWVECYAILPSVELEWARDELLDVSNCLPPSQCDCNPDPQSNQEGEMQKSYWPIWLIAEMLKAVGEGGVDLARQLVEAVFSSDEITADWEERVTLGRGNYADLKITDEVMKLLVQVLDFYICKKVNIDKMQYSLLSGRANTYTIFVVHQLQKKYIAVKKMLYFAIINHDKVFDHVFRKAQWWALRSLGVEEWAVCVNRGLYS